MEFDRSYWAKRCKSQALFAETSEEIVNNQSFQIHFYDMILQSFNIRVHEEECWRSLLCWEEASNEHGNARLISNRFKLDFSYKSHPNSEKLDFFIEYLTPVSCVSTKINWSPWIMIDRQKDQWCSEFSSSEMIILSITDLQISLIHLLWSHSHKRSSCNFRILSLSLIISL